MPANEQTAYDAAKYYGAMAHLRDVVPVRVSVPLTLTGNKGCVIFYGIRYHDSNHDAAEVRHLFFGEQPKQHQKRIRTVGGTACQRFVYRLPDDEGDWFVAGYMREPIKEQYAWAHPFGANFVLCRWSHERSNEAIDKWDDPPGRRVRIPIEITVLKPKNDSPGVRHVPADD